MKRQSNRARPTLPPQPARSRRRLLALATLLAGAAGAAVGLTSSVATPRAAAGGSGSSGATFGPAAGPGTRLSYRIHLASHADLTLGVGPQTIDEQLSGALELTVMAVDARGYEALVRTAATSAQLTLDGRSTADGASKLDAGLGQGFLCRYGADGALESISVPPEFDSMTEASAHQLAALLQAPRDRSKLALGGPHAWTATERDGMGTYRARYTRADGSDQDLHLDKEILSYDQDDGHAAGQGAGITPKPGGKLALVLDGQDGVLKSVHGSQLTELVYAAGGSGGRSTTAVELTLTQRGQLPADDVLALSRELAARQLAATAQRPGTSRNAEAAARDVQRRELEGKSLATLTAELGSLDLSAEPAAEQARRHLYTQLRALMLLQPDEALAIGRYGAGLAADGVAFNLVVGALAATQTAEAQAGLRLMIEAVTDKPRLVAQLVPTLSMYEQPTPATESYIRRLSETAADAEVRDSARLGLGIVASRLSSSGESERSKVLVGEALGALAAAKEPADTTLALKAVGNTGAPEALAAVTPYLGSPSTLVRQQAANALRFVPGAGADAALLGALAGDGDDGVRAAAADALGYRLASEELLAAEQKRFAAESSVDVRVRLLRDIFNARSRYPDAALAFVRDVGDRSDVAELREAAQRLVSTVN